MTYQGPDDLGEQAEFSPDNPMFYQELWERDTEARAICSHTGELIAANAAARVLMDLQPQFGVANVFERLSISAIALERLEAPYRVKTNTHVIEFRPFDGHTILEIVPLERDPETAIAAGLAEIRSQLLRNVLHALRTPASNAKVRAYLAGKQPDKAAQHLEVLSAELNKQEKVLNALNDLVILAQRIETGFSVVPLHMTSIVTETIEPHLSSEVNVAINLPDIEVTIRGDRDSIWTAVKEIVGNAFNFRKPDTQHDVTVSLSQSDGYCHIEVSDTGIGIPVDQFDKIFTDFYVGDESNHRGGAGVGLAIAKLVVEAHGGWIDVRSQVGEGSPFTIHMRRAQ